MNERQDRIGLPESALSAWMAEAFQVVCPDSADLARSVAVVPATDPAFGDYQCNAAMGLAKAVKQPPRKIAEAAVRQAGSHEAVDKIELAGPGFINLWLKNDWLARRMEEIAADPRVCVPETGGNRTIVMDYGSPNMCKPLHIGHLRSPNIGSAIDRMFRFLGYRVLADNHLGDWGTQFGITIMGYRHFGDEKAMEESPMEELERVYVESYARAREDAGWMDQCRAELVKLQSGDPENTRLWKKFMELSLKELDRIYGRLGVRYDLVRGESFYNDRLKNVVDILLKKGLARESEGALMVFLDDEKLPPAMVRKSDGGFNYATTDLATVMSRIEEFHPDRIIYVTDERQQLHFRQFFTIARKMGMEAGLVHVWFGLMRLPEGTFSTRDGNVIKLDRLLDEAVERAAALVKEQSQDMTPDRQAEVARAVGLGAVKYADISQNPQSLVTFTWEKALAMNGNSAPYLQYAYARISSVRDKYTERFPGGRLDCHPVRITDPTERDLAVRLVRFPATVVQAAETYKPSVLSDYLYDLAQAYSTYYQNVPFLKAEEGVRESRVRICGAVAAVLRKGLELLGIETPERI